MRFLVVFVRLLVVSVRLLVSAWLLVVSVTVRKVCGSAVSDRLREVAGLCEVAGLWAVAGRFCDGEESLRRCG